MVKKWFASWSAMDSWWSSECEVCIVHGNSFGGTSQPSITGGVRTSCAGWESENGGSGGMYAEDVGNIECGCAGSETVGGYDFGGGRGLTFNTAASGMVAAQPLTQKAALKNSRSPLIPTVLTLGITYQT